MPLILSIAAIGLLGQVDPAAAGMKHYVFVERGDTTISLHVLVDPKYLDQTLNPFLDAILDEPWLPVNERYKKLRRSDYKEPYIDQPSLRNRRIREGWLAHGGVEVDTSEGRIWIHKEEYELAQRADEMGAAVHRGDTAAPVPARPPTDDAAREPLGFWAEWRIHIGIIGGAVVLTAFVIWATMVRGPWKALRP